VPGWTFVRRIPHHDSVKKLLKKVTAQSIQIGIWVAVVMALSLAPYAHAAVHGEDGTAVEPVSLTTGGRVDPLGIGMPDAMFAWKLQAVPAQARNLRQEAYRIMVASSAAALGLLKGNVWDSGRVSSHTYWQIAYRGPALHSGTTYFWAVEAWSAGASQGTWSKPAQFTTAMLSPDDWKAEWIAATPDRDAKGVDAGSTAGHPMPVFRRQFDVGKPVASALLYVSGLGQYEVRLDGKNVTDTVLNPGWTDYRKSVLYNTYDVKTELRPGKHAFGVLLGNGMYNVQQTKGRYSKFTGTFGQPKLWLQLALRYKDGTTQTIVSDGSWKTHAGPVTFSSTYGGEDFDAGALPAGWDTTGFDQRGWSGAITVAGPGGALQPQQAPPMVVAQVYRPVKVTTPKPGVTVYDLGDNMSGWPAIAVEGPAGARVRLLAGELLNPDGTVTQRSANAGPTDPVLFDYTLRGGALESWHPRFSYYSFRYVQVTTTAAHLGGVQPKVLRMTGDFVHDQVTVAGRFHSSDELYDRIHTLIDRAVLSNLASVLTDCPSREKLGWLEQTYLNASTLMLNYDVSGLYEKMSRDIADAQRADGLVPSIAPEYVAFVDDKGRNTPFRDSPEWGSAAVLSPWALYRWTGDEEPLRSSYGVMQRYVAYLKSQTKDDLLDYGLGDWYDIGPNPPGESQLTSKTVTATGVYDEDLQAMAQIATLLGHTDDAVRYAAEAASVRAAYNTRLFHPETNEYDRGSQTANAIPLALGIVPDRHRMAVLANLIADIHAHHDHVTAGDVGFHYVVRALTDAGRSDVLAAMMARTDAPSYGYQLAQGATTLTEAWDANRDSSQNHFMLGHGEEWFYRGLAGISVDMARGPQEAVTLEPSLLASVHAASASYLSAMGEIQLAWERSGSAGSVQLTIPAGAHARVVLPAAREWSEDGKKLPETASENTATGEIVLSLGSGRYRFAATGLTR
jgi:alpha-L-rhamnosidase